MVEQTESDVYLENQLRDTTTDWFYWAFCVEGAQGREVTFHFNQSPRMGYWGPAFSHDLRSWHWLNSADGESFSYWFKKDESKVYFAHHMLYGPERFFDFAKNKGIKIKKLCTTKSGNDVPYIDIGNGNEIIFLSARHHACESTGSYVLEGALEEFTKDEYFQRYRIICVPFADYDGVINGDQGKNRSPYDHNRDYDIELAPIYSTTAKIREIAKNLPVKYAFDFHSPWHMGGQNDTVFIPIKSHKAVNKISEFSEILETKNHPESLPYFEKDNYPPDTGWNKSDTPTFAVYFENYGAALSFTLETPYFLATNTAFSPQEAIELGRNFARALKQYDNLRY